MQTEFEATFTNINKDEIRQKLTELGAKCVKPEVLMRRVIFYPPIEDDLGWMRVRDEGDVITMSYKRFPGYQKQENKIEDQQEICLEIKDFDQGVEMLKFMGAKQKAYQETKRENWSFGNLEISLDTWPGLNPFIEIEGQNEKEVKEVAKKLGFNYSEALFGPVHLVYEQELGIPAEVINNQIPQITFGNPPQKYDA